MEIDRNPPTTFWGKVFEELREKRERSLGKRFSRYKLAKIAGMPATEYRNLLQGGKGGPTFEKIESILKATSFTWHDWADAYDAVSNGENHHRTGQGPTLDVPHMDVRSDKELDERESDRKNLNLIKANALKESTAGSLEFDTTHVHDKIKEQKKKNRTAKPSKVSVRKHSA